MCAEPRTGWATMSYLPSLYCLRSSDGKAMRRSSSRIGTGLRTDSLLFGGEDARQVDFVELDRGLGGRLDGGLHAVGLLRRLLEGVGQLEAEGGERLGIGLGRGAAGQGAVHAARELDEDLLGQLDVGLLRIDFRLSRLRGGGGGCAHGLSVLISS